MGVTLSPVKDLNLELKDAGLVAASAAAQVGGVDRILSLGLGYPSTDALGPVWEADIHISVTAIEVATGDELYEIEWQLSSSPTFASDVVVSSILRLGDSSVTFNSADSTTGHYIMHVSNCTHNPETARYQYGRLYTRVAGTVATGINYSAFAAEDVD